VTTDRQLHVLTLWKKLTLVEYIYKVAAKCSIHYINILAADISVAERIFVRTIWFYIKSYSFFTVDIIC